MGSYRASSEVAKLLYILFFKNFRAAFSESLVDVNSGFDKSYLINEALFYYAIEKLLLNVFLSPGYLWLKALNYCYENYCEYLYVFANT